MSEGDEREHPSEQPDAPPPPEEENDGD